MKKIKITRVAFVIDKSSSMRGLINKAIDAVNQNIETIRESVKEKGQAVTVSVYTFNNKLDPLFLNRPISACVPIEHNSILCAGLTALYDATVDVTSRLADTFVAKDDDISYIVNVMTDGYENDSTNNAASLRRALDKHQKTDRWTFTFLVPENYRNHFIRCSGISEGNILAWDQTAQGVQKYSDANDNAFRSYFRNREKGKTSTTSFYTDLSNVDKTSLDQVLNDVSRSVTLLKVNKESKIRDFVEAKGLPYTKGCAFYELTSRKEGHKVQPYKKIMIMEKKSPNKKKKKVYTGAEARKIIGLPDTETKVRPGAHGNYDIFVQSTSVNRKLMPGTKIIYVDA